MLITMDTLPIDLAQVTRGPNPGYCNFLSLCHTHTRTHARTHALTHSLTYTHTHSRTHALTHSLTHLHTHTLTHARTHARTHAHTHTHTHTHTRRDHNTNVARALQLLSAAYDKWRCCRTVVVRHCMYITVPHGSYLGDSQTDWREGAPPRSILQHIHTHVHVHIEALAHTFQIPCISLKERPKTHDMVWSS